MPNKKEIILSDDGQLVYLPDVSAMVNIGEGSNPAPAAKVTSPVEDITSSTDFVEWGDDNDYPGMVEERAHKNTLIPSTLHFKASHMAAADLHYGYVTGFDEKTRKPIIQQFIHPEIESFWGYNNKRLFLEDGYRNLYWWHHAFVDFILDKSKKKIVAISVADSTHCRYSTQDSTGNKPYVFIDANWPDGSEKTWQKVRCVDPYYDWIGQMQRQSGYRFIYPLFFNSPKRTYYQRVPWHSIIDSKWLDLAEKIPTFKAKLMDNQMVIKYVLHVPEEAWRTDYPKWDSMTAEERRAARLKKTEEFNKVLTGIEKTGKSIMLTFKSDAYGKAFAKWEVQEMKGNLGEGSYIEDSQEASDHILYAMAFDGTLIGKTPGKSMGSGSGSDKRLADEIFFKNNKSYALKLCEALTVLTQYNNLRGPSGEQIVWFQEEQILTTLNNVTPENRP
ncbi:MAG TPA: hypothetical protein PLU58_01625 [Saprospiraceae bacterium]|jgi:hypothetical protein|nr:hypothetical protein [Saprospiraceae bacterium]